MSTEAGRGRDDDSLAAAAPSAAHSRSHLKVAAAPKCPATPQPRCSARALTIAAAFGLAAANQVLTVALHHGFQVEVLGTRRPALVMRAGEDGGEYRGEDNG